MSREMIIIRIILCISDFIFAGADTALAITLLKRSEWSHAVLFLFCSIFLFINGYRYLKKIVTIIKGGYK